MDIFNRFAANPDLEEEGKEIEISKGFFITVGRAHNKTYDRVMSKLYEQFKHELDMGGPDAEARAEAITIEVMSKSILLGWRTVDADGNSSPTAMFKGEKVLYSQRAAKEFLALKDFRTLVTKHSENFQNFRLVAEDEDVKKSVPTLSGT